MTRLLWPMRAFMTDQKRLRADNAHVVCNGHFGPDRTLATAQESGSRVILKRRQEGLHSVWLIECPERLEQGEGAFEEASRSADVTRLLVELGLGHQRLCHFVTSSHLF
jgi:hypothetical protein